MDEFLDLIDENGKITGQKVLRKEVHKNGLLHHASGVMIYSTGGGREQII